MAAAPSDKKKVMDVAKPGKTAASATTRPLIVSHSGAIIDPSVNDDVKSAPVPSADALNGQSGITITKPRGPKVVQPLGATADKPEDAAEEKQAEPEEKLPVLPIETVEEASEPAEESSPEVMEPAKQDEAEQAMSNEAVSTPSEEAPNDAPEEPEADESSAESEAKDTDTSDNETDEGSKDSTETESENAAIVDAVVDQANIGKKQKEEDKETVARKELVAKLIEEKKYFIPIKQKNTTRSGRMTMVLSILGVLVVLGGYAVVDAGVIDPGFDVPVHFLKKKEVAISVTTPAATPAANAPVPAQSTEPKTTPTTLTYDSKELGINFVYPSAWGEVATKKEAGTSGGSTVSITFSKQPMLKASMLTTNYKTTANGAGCFTSADMTGDLTFESIKDTMTKQIQAGSSPTTVRTLLKSTDTVFAYERFESGEATATSCVGLTVAGYKKFTDQQYTGLHLVWKDPAQKSVPQTDIAKYKASPNDFLSDQNRKDILAVLDSAKSQ